MMSAYVQLERRFREVKKGQSVLPSALIDRLGDGKTWEDLTPVDAPDPQPDLDVVVILAASGFGKTAELQARSAALQGSPLVSFFLRAADIAVGGVEGTVDDKSRFSSWRDSDERGVFFIDAIDEVRLLGLDLQSVLRFVRNEVVAPARGAVRLVISSRNDLGAEDYERQIADALKRDGIKPSVRSFILADLSLSDVRRYVEAQGVSDVAAFMAAFEEEDLGDVCGRRPPDVRSLIAYWEQHGYFGSRSEMLEVSIEASLREDNQRHANHRQIALEDARGALMRLGAATILGKQPLITRQRSASSGAVNAEKLFADQRPAWTEQLLAMGLFVHKGLEAVQLTQGPLSNYLAAQWIKERVKRGWDPRKLEELLFVTPPGERRGRIPSSRRQLAAWVAGVVPEVRDRMAREQPHVLLFEGDPALLSRGVCIAALRSVMEGLIASGELTNPEGWFLRRLATHQLCDEVLHWLEKSALATSAQWLLLRLAEAGRYQAVVPHALALALAPDGVEQVSAAAVRVVGLCGTEQHREQLLALTDHRSEWVRLEVIRMLAPEAVGGQGILRGEALVQMVLEMEMRGIPSARGHFAPSLANVLAKVSLSDIEAILRALSPSIAGSQRNVAPVTNAHTEIACKLAHRWLQRSGGDVPDWMLELLLRIERRLGWTTFVLRWTIEPLKLFLSKNQVLRRRLWEARVAAADAACPGIPHDLKLGEVQAEDLEWIWSLNEKSENQSPMGSLAFRLTQALAKTPQHERARLMQAAQVAPGLRGFLEAEESRERERQEAVRQQAAEKQRKTDEVLAGNITKLQPLRADIETGQRPDILEWAWNHLADEDHEDDEAGQRSRGRPPHWSRSGIRRLKELVGAELAEAFVAGFQKRWRAYAPPLPLTQEALNDETKIGLTGLKLEIERGLDLSRLPDPDAERAARYAVHEINGLPMWFDELRRAHTAIVASVLAELVRLEWHHPTESHGVIARAPYEPPGIAELIRDLVVRQLKQQAPAHASMVSSAIRALLPHPGLARDIGPVLKGYVHEAAEGDVHALAEWLRGWSHFDPLAAAEWLGALARSDLARFRAVVLEVGALLEEDFAEVVGTLTLSWAPEALEAWVRISFLAVRPEEDLDRSGGGGYSPIQRDHAQDFRSRCIRQLAREPSSVASEALRRLRVAKNMVPYRTLLDQLIEAQLDVAVEHMAQPWDEADILEVERGDERQPKNNAELFAMVRRHLARVRDLLENDDFSYVSVDV